MGAFLLGICICLHVAAIVIQLLVACVLFYGPPGDERRIRCECDCVQDYRHDRVPVLPGSSPIGSNKP